MSDYVDSHLDNLATAATHGNEIVQGTINHIAWSANNQHSKFKKLPAEIKSALPSIGRNNNGGGGSGSGGTSAVHTTATATQKATLDRRIAQLQTSVKRKWIQIGFCYSQGHGVAYKHNSNSCHNKATGHVNTATCEYPAGPITNKNKGWDDWLLI